MPELRYCKECRKLFQYVSGIALCPECKKKDDEEFEQVRFFFTRLPRCKYAGGITIYRGKSE